MDVEEKIKLITRNTEEVVTVEELRDLLIRGEKLEGYLGYEPSGLFHIGWMVWAYKAKDLVEAGVNLRLLEATWHAWVNDKFNGNMQVIKDDAKYIRHSLKAIGIPVEKIKFIDAEDLVSDKDYWALLLKVAKNTTLARAKRTLTIMGRKEEEAELDSSKIIYPFMQATDIYYMGLNIALGGIDQRKVHMLVRELAEKVGAKKIVAIHTPLLTGLQGSGRAGGGSSKDEIMSEVKMSKSKPESTIIIHDSPEDIREKIMNAYCPKQVVEFNPIIEINKYLLFSQDNFSLYVERPSEYGGPIEIYSYDELERMYLKGEIHPLDLKKATADALIKKLEPARKYFEDNKEAKELALKIASELKIEINL